jgi:hypothetical protein
MKHFAFILLLVSSTAVAAQRDVCVPAALGVPTREGPPKWLDWTGSGPIASDPSLDDPRWLGATSQTLPQAGGATAPLQMRALHYMQGSQEYLYLSFIVDLMGFMTSNGSDPTSTPRDIFIGFHRPSPAAGATERGYMFQFHLNGNGSGVVAPSFCSQYSTCDEDSGTATDFWRVFVDKGHTDQSACTENSGALYEAVPSVTDPVTHNLMSTVTWVTTPGGAQDAVRFWKIATNPAPLLQNRWAVEVRIPIIDPVAGATSPILTGIERGSTFFYEATAKLPGPGNGGYAKIAWFPQELTTSVCPDNSKDQIVHEELGNTSAACPLCNPLLFSKLTDIASPAISIPADCQGIDIDSDHIGVLFDMSIPTDPALFQAFRPNKQFTASSTDPMKTNHVIALPFNTSSTAISAPLQARFRLAGWGSRPWSSTTDTGTWKDIRGAENGVCASGTSPACGAVSINPGQQGLITFDWTIGKDPTNGSSEYCEYGLTPPASIGDKCSTVKCDCPAHADGTPPDCAAGTGVQALKIDPATHVQTGMWPCVPSIYQNDQCMLVELNAPNGTATFVQSSIWSNMTFGEMSVLAHTALIDARELPKAPGQQFQDIYFIAMPRNMPASVPPTTTAVQLAQQGALSVALRIAQPYIDDIHRTPPDQIAVIRKRLNNGAVLGGQGGGSGSGGDGKQDPIADLRLARQIMPAPVGAQIDALIAVITNSHPQDNKPNQTQVHDVVTSLGSATAAQIVPTLEIYPFYQPLGKGTIYTPMTAFTVFLSHESTLSGMRYQIDGATQVGANIYHMQIPVGFARQIQVRAQAITSGEAALPPGMPKWPCTGGCAACGGGNRNCGLVSLVGNGLPAVIAGVLVVRRRRRKPAATQAKQPPAAS